MVARNVTCAATAGFSNSAKFAQVKKGDMRKGNETTRSAQICTMLVKILGMNMD